MSSIKSWQQSKLYIIVRISCSFQFSIVHLDLSLGPNKYKFKVRERAVITAFLVVMTEYMISDD